MIRRRFITKSKINIEDYCTVVALEDGWTVRMETKAYYSIDGSKWELVLARSYTPPIKMGQTISFCAVDEDVSFSNNHVDSALQKCELKGNIMSLIFGYDAKNKDELLTGRFTAKFSGWRGLVSVNSNFLPFTTLVDYCYSSMFSGCTSLVNAPELPATTLAEYCYNSMFNNCTSLVNAPELPATTLANGCYSDMFDNCTSLVNAPELPATTLAVYCYSDMFRGCSSLISAPELPATTLVNSCYDEMFFQCTNLNYIKALFTTAPSLTYTKNWVSYVPNTGTFVKNPEATWEIYGTSGIPDGWNVVMDGEEKELIKFYFFDNYDEIVLYAEQGMTWGEWIDSEYKEDYPFSVDELDRDSVTYENNYWVGDDYGYVSTSDIIVEDAYYFAMG